MDTVLNIPQILSWWLILDPSISSDRTNSMMTPENSTMCWPSSKQKMRIRLELKRNNRKWQWWSRRMNTFLQWMISTLWTTRNCVMWDKAMSWDTETKTLWSKIKRQSLLLSLVSWYWIMPLSVFIWMKTSIVWWLPILWTDWLFHWSILAICRIESISCQPMETLLKVQSVEAIWLVSWWDSMISLRLMDKARMELPKRPSVLKLKRLLSIGSLPLTDSEAVNWECFRPLKLWTNSRTLQLSRLLPEMKPITLWRWEWRNSRRSMRSIRMNRLLSKTLWLSNLRAEIAIWKMLLNSSKSNRSTINSRWRSKKPASSLLLKRLKVQSNRLIVYWIRNPKMLLWETETTCLNKSRKPKTKKRLWKSSWSISCCQLLRKLLNRTNSSKKKDWNPRKEAPRSFRTSESLRLNPTTWVRSSYVMILSWESLILRKQRTRILILTTTARPSSVTELVKFWKDKPSICCSNVWILTISATSAVNSKAELSLLIKKKLVKKSVEMLWKILWALLWVSAWTWIKELGRTRANKVGSDLSREEPRDSDYDCHHI